MKFIAILGVFISSTITVFGQESTYIKIVTNQGIYVGKRTESGQPSNILVKDGLSTSVLESYFLFGYRPSKNRLIVGTKPKNSPYNDVTVTELYEYDITTNKFLPIGNYGINGMTGIYGKITLDGDKLTFRVNTKREKPKVGSECRLHTITLK